MHTSLGHGTMDNAVIAAMEKDMLLAKFVENMPKCPFCEFLSKGNMLNQGILQLKEIHICYNHLK